MVDEPVAPTPSRPQEPAGTTTMKLEVSAKTYRLKSKEAIAKDVLTTVQNVGIAAIAVVLAIGKLNEGQNIDENTLLVIISICIFIILIIAAVYLWEKIQDATSFSITTDNTGLTLQEHKKEIVTIAWDKVVSFEDYKVRGVDGTRKVDINLREQLRDRDELKEVIEKNAAESITKHLVLRFRQEGKLTLGIVDITQKGLLFKEQFIPWEDIADIDIDEDKIVRIIMSSFKLRRIAPVSKIPNYSTLVELVRNQRPGARAIERPEPGTPRAEDFERAVFISYAWGGQSEELVNQIDRSLQARGIKIVRDKRELEFKGSITEFMKRIGKGNCIIVVISDKYLRSPNCMFELVEIADNKQFHDRIFPIVLADANIYDPVQRLDYVKYWEDKLVKLDQAMKGVGQANLQGIREDMDNYDRFRDKISGLTSILKDMNTLTSDIHQESNFSELYERIEKRQRTL